ncbi:MAG TPA: PqqD family protein [Gemmatimonadaceae bacterium]|nr:PqqD family protein [Gemmatimonadaceae bacterium]
MTEQRYRLHPDLRLTALADEGVLLHLGERKYFSVNDTGLSMLEALRQPRTLDELVHELLESYDATEADARESAQAFLDRCLRASVIVPDAPEP